MRFWPQKTWKKILFVLCLILIVLAVAGAVVVGYVFLNINKDVVSSIDVMNSGGTARALVVYQVGLSSAPRDASYAFSEGLASNGWRVEITTASPEAPSDLSDYKLLILTFPIYGDLPGEAIVRYVTRLGDLQQIRTVIINSGSLNVVMKAQVEAQNGTVIENLLYGATDLRQEGSQIAP